MAQTSFYANSPLTSSGTSSPSYQYVPPLSALEFICDGSGSVLQPGTFGYLEVPYNCTINSMTLMADQVGACVLDVRRTTAASFSPPTHPSAADSITGSDPPTLSSNGFAQDSTLSTWTTSLSKGDIIGVAVISATTVTRVTLSLKVQRI